METSEKSRRHKKQKHTILGFWVFSTAHPQEPPKKTHIYVYIYIYTHTHFLFFSFFLVCVLVFSTFHFQESHFFVLFGIVHISSPRVPNDCFLWVFPRKFHFQESEILLFLFLLGGFCFFHILLSRVRKFFLVLKAHMERSPNKNLENRTPMRGHIYIYTYTCLCMYVPTYVRTYIYGRTYEYTCIHAGRQTHTHTYTHTYIHAYIRTYVHTYVHTYIHTYIHTYMHACMHACMHTHIYI